MKFLYSFLYYILAGSGLSTALVAPRQAAECVAATAGGPIQVTADCIDPLYSSPVIVSETDQTSPSAHRLVSGYFNGTGLQFNIYLPPKAQFGNRFFQWVYPIQNADANSVVPDTVAFCFNSKAYAVQVTGTSGFRGDAAGAKFSKLIAAKYYNLPLTRHIYGYVYGGSGGSLVAVGAAELSKGVWDGVIPIVQAVPVSVPNNLAARALASLVLRNQTSSIEDALLPGGSDPYAKLNSVQRSALLEATKFGIALQAWQGADEVTSTSTLIQLASVVKGLDPTYQNDFWTKPGYLGTEVSDLGDLVRAAKFEFTSIIQKVERDGQNLPLSLILENVPANLPTVGVDYNLYSSDDQLIGPLTGTLDSSSGTFTLTTGNSNATLMVIANGLKLRIDNRWFIALHAYYRYQVPRRAGFYGFDQFRNANGQPIYPQRPIEIGSIISKSTSGGATHTGAINMKVIQVDNLFDVDAYPWHADWYRSQVKASLGSRFNDNYRIWYNDHSDHFFEQLPKNRTNYLVQYTGVYHQALRDLVDWVENGKAPPLSTSYTVKDSQIVVPASAKDRLGVQPVAQLRVGGQARITVRAGKTVNFEAKMEVPPGAGKLVKAEWDFYGTGDFVDAGLGSPKAKAEITGKFSYPKPGTYFVGLRVTSKRDPQNAFAGIQNMDRVRVVVT
ncbi:hypothetical protein BKA64DRAFT_628841 [Cadophora sp. MPI-SDFR-AT-0126]|nr:hypothetical protein BKA64DRAFT_628841 [Leotiomycetes sp. MPI-SDFR-AT-0126]